jgi:hypothetical protein
MGERICLFTPPTGLDANPIRRSDYHAGSCPHSHLGSAYRFDRAFTRSTTVRFRQATPCGANDLWWFRNINRMSIAYDFRPRLRPD